MAEVVLYPCTVKRRGKAAKGTIQIETFGKPIVNEDGIAIAWDYSELPYSIEEAIEATSKIGNSLEFILTGADKAIRSQSNQQQGQAFVLAARLFAAGLAIDKDEAKSVAIAILGVRANSLKLGIPEEMVPSIEVLIDGRKKIVDKMKASGEWLSKRLKLEKEANPGTEQIVNLNKSDDDDDDED